MITTLYDVKEWFWKWSGLSGRSRVNWEALSDIYTQFLGGFEFGGD